MKIEIQHGVLNAAIEKIALEGESGRSKRELRATATALSDNAYFMEMVKNVVDCWEHYEDDSDGVKALSAVQLGFEMGYRYAVELQRKVN